MKSLFCLYFIFALICLTPFYYVCASTSTPPDDSPVKNILSLKNKIFQEKCISPTISYCYQQNETGEVRRNLLLATKLNDAGTKNKKILSNLNAYIDQLAIKHLNKKSFKDFVSSLAAEYGIKTSESPLAKLPLDQFLLPENYLSLFQYSNDDESIFGLGQINDIRYNYDDAVISGDLEKMASDEKIILKLLQENINLININIRQRLSGQILSGVIAGVCKEISVFKKNGLSELDYQYYYFDQNNHIEAQTINLKIFEQNYCLRQFDYLIDKKIQFDEFLPIFHWKYFKNNFQVILNNFRNKEVINKLEGFSSSIDDDLHPFMLSLSEKLAKNPYFNFSSQVKKYFYQLVFSQEFLFYFQSELNQYLPKNFDHELNKIFSELKMVAQQTLIGSKLYFDSDLQEIMIQLQKARFLNPVEKFSTNDFESSALIPSLKVIKNNPANYYLKFISRNIDHFFDIHLGFNMIAYAPHSSIVAGTKMLLLAANDPILLLTVLSHEISHLIDINHYPHLEMGRLNDFKLSAAYFDGHEKLKQCLKENNVVFDPGHASEAFADRFAAEMIAGLINAQNLSPDQFSLLDWKSLAKTKQSINLLNAFCYLLFEEENFYEQNGVKPNILFNMTHGPHPFTLTRSDYLFAQHPIIKKFIGCENQHESLFAQMNYCELK